jgi:Tol biopolymer transport system component
VPAISADGARIAFAAAANTGMQIYLYDDAQGSVTLLSATPAGTPAKGNSSQPSMNAAGTVIAFATEANDVVVSGSRGQICVRNLSQAQTVIGSVTTSGQPCHGVCRSPSLSADGTLLTFLSTAEDLPGVSKPKSQPPGSLPSRLFVTRLADHQYAILGGTLKP